MSARNFMDYTFKDVIPIFLDFPANMVEKIAKSTTQIPVYFVTCKDIYDMLKKAGSNNVYFIPLSISDKYYSCKVPVKSIEVI